MTAPHSPVRGVRRAIRVAVLGGSSVLLAAAAHTLAGAMLPPWWLLLVLSAFVGTIAAALTTRRLRFGPLLAVLVIEQAGLHLALGLGGACPAQVEPGTGHMSGMTMVACSGGPPAGTTVGTTTVGVLTSMWPMLLGHLVATLLTAALLAHGEALLWRIAGRLIPGATTRPTRRRPRVSRAAIPVRVLSSSVVDPATAGPRAPPRTPLAAG